MKLVAILFLLTGCTTQPTVATKSVVITNPKPPLIFCFVSGAGYNVEIQGSTNLISWFTLTNFTTTEGTNIAWQEAANSRKQFFVRYTYN